MALYQVDLAKLAVASARVTVRSFSSMFENSLFSYRIWVLSQLPATTQQERALHSDVDAAIRIACGKTVVLMKGGVADFVEWLATQIAEIQKKHEGLPIVPIMNQDIKSDAWLTGLVTTKLAEKGISFNPGQVGFALDGKQAGLTAKGKPIVTGPFVLLLIDDASYSGTQAQALMVNAGICGLFGDIRRNMKGAYLLLAGASEVAKRKFEGSPVMIIAECDPMPSGPFGSAQVLTAIRQLPVLADRASATKGVYASHREVDPDTGQLKATTGEFPTFTNLSYALPPYKIPDSLSVPVHVYAACGYTNEHDELPRVMYNARLPSKLAHLFQGTGSIDYRTTLRNLRGGFLTKIA